MSRLESLMLEGPAGKLEALLEIPDGEPVRACLVCHPHPLYGGTMHNKVVHRTARGLRRAGGAVLRFNFRGAGRSEGSYAQGIGELEDARAALGWLRERYPSLPYTLAGFSFGARIALALGCTEERPERVIALGLPTHWPLPEGLPGCTVPKVFIQSTRDQFGPKEELEALFAQLPEPKRLIWIEAQDHFFAGALDRLEETIRGLDGETPARYGTFA
ncbi:MAG TPA: alpha/beta hydrolase [Bryobacteraceae bacterium]|nr:alpha/beta hydrolase [Bryobacteraceae bacterium]HOQ46416.1 alpha/beta hydrolase [Bryobacteraceae bacterium]HPQ17442.1 alpha/beta hydrolase [Bryobacteraceae bacterium]HPU72577.1 alpha/beta hydrolase [Bryobacteraceae bacterium]